MAHLDEEIKYALCDTIAKEVKRRKRIGRTEEDDAVVYLWMPIERWLSYGCVNRFMELLKYIKLLISSPAVQRNESQDT